MVRKTAPGEWTVTRPRVGFGGPEVVTRPTARAAWRWLRSLERRGAHVAAGDRARHVATGVATQPRWARKRPFQY